MPKPAGARPYGPGDDARRIDWNLTARALSPHVRTTEADRELETVIVADRSASLDFGTAQREKREVVLAAVAAFGFLTVRAGNRLGVLIAGGDKISPLPPAAGTLGLMSALSALYDTPRRETPPARDADLAAALVRLERTQPRRGQVVIVSDFLDGTDWAAAAAAARAAPPGRGRAGHRPAGVRAAGGRHAVGGRRRDRSAAPCPDQLAQPCGPATPQPRPQRQKEIRSAIPRAGAEHLVLSTDRDWLRRHRPVRRPSPHGAGPGPGARARFVCARRLGRSAAHRCPDCTEVAA